MAKALMNKISQEKCAPKRYGSIFNKLDFLRGYSTRQALQYERFRSTKKPKMGKPHAAIVQLGPRIHLQIRTPDKEKKGI